MGDALARALYMADDYGWATDVRPWESLTDALKERWERRAANLILAAPECGVLITITNQGAS